MSSAPTSGFLETCPNTLEMPLTWDQVRYYTNPVTGKRGFDRLTSPIPIPHKDLKFSGYVKDEALQTVSAFFVKDGIKAKKGCRLARPSGGVNKEYFDGLQQCTSRESRAKYKREKSDLYTPHSKRFGLHDPEI